MLVTLGPLASAVREAVAGAEAGGGVAGRCGLAVGLVQGLGGQGERGALGVDQAVAAEAEDGRGIGGEGAAVEVEAARAGQGAGGRGEAVDVDEPACAGLRCGERVRAGGVVEVAAGGDDHGVAGGGAGDDGAGVEAHAFLGDERDLAGGDGRAEGDAAGAGGGDGHRQGGDVGRGRAARGGGREEEVGAGGEAEERADAGGDGAGDAHVAAVGDVAAGLRPRRPRSGSPPRA